MEKSPTPMGVVINLKLRKLLICLRKRKKEIKIFFLQRIKWIFNNPSSKVSGPFLWITIGDYIRS